MTRISQFNVNQTGYLQPKRNKQQNTNFKAKFYIDKANANDVWKKLNQNLKFDFIGLIPPKGSKKYGKYCFEPHLTDEEKRFNDKKKNNFIKEANEFLENILKSLGIKDYEKVD
jgi:hypothetical protein